MVLKQYLFFNAVTFIELNLFNGFNTCLNNKEYQKITTTILFKLELPTIPFHQVKGLKNVILLD